MKQSEIGERIKGAAKENKYTNRDVADLLHYSSEKQISPFYKGKRRFRDEQINILANAFHVRPEYLQGKDNWKTEQEMYAAVKQTERDNYACLINYLKTVGLILKPEVCFVGNRYEFFQSYFFLRPCISDDVAAHLSDIKRLRLPDQFSTGITEDLPNKPLTFSGLYDLVKNKSSSPTENCNEDDALDVDVEDYYDDEGFFDPDVYLLDELLESKNPYDDEDTQEICVSLKSNPKDGTTELIEYYSDNSSRTTDSTSLKDLSEITKEDKIPDADRDLYDGLPDQWRPYINDLRYGSLEIRYRAVFDGKTTEWLDINHVSSFFKQVDALAKTSIETFLFCE